MKRKITSLMLAGAICAALCGCGQEPASTENTAEQSTETADSGTEKVYATESVFVTEEEEDRGELPTITFEHNASGSTESASITAVDASGATVWTYTTGSYELAQCDRISDIGLEDTDYYFVEDGSVICLDAYDGTVLWKNADFGGTLAMTAFAFDLDQTLYIAGYMGPDLCIIDKDGNTLKLIDEFSSDYQWPYDMELSGNELTITYEAGLPSMETAVGVVNLDDFTVTYH